MSDFNKENYNIEINNNIKNLFLLELFFGTLYTFYWLCFVRKCNIPYAFISFIFIIFFIFDIIIYL